MPGDDVVAPALDRSTEPTHFERHGVVGEVADDFIDPGVGESGVGVVVDLADDFFGAPGELDLALGVTGGERPDEPLERPDSPRTCA